MWWFGINIRITVQRSQRFVIAWQNDGLPNLTLHHDHITTLCWNIYFILFNLRLH